MLDWDNQTAPFSYISINMKIMNAVIFCRVSSKEQQETGYSLPAQEKFLNEYADRCSITPTKVFAVAESAAGHLQRKVFTEMMQYIRKNNINILIVETTDRLTRNFADVPLVDKWINEDVSHQLHLAKEGCILNRDSKSNEWFMWRVKVATAEYYVKLLSENVRKGQKEKIEQGWLPTKPPLGYTTIGEQGHRIHVIDEKTKGFALRMFDLYASGNYSTLRIADILYEEGLRSDKGRKVPKSRIHQYLSDPFYIGKFLWNDQVYNGKHEPLITESLFNEVQRLLKGRYAPRYQKHHYLFRGMIRCSYCNGVITWEKQKENVYGHCNGYRNCPKKPWVKEKDAEQQILQELDDLLLTNTRIAEWIHALLQEKYHDDIERQQNSKEELQRMADTLKKRLDRIYEDRLDGIIDEEMYRAKRLQYQKEKEAIEAKINSEKKPDTLDLSPVKLFEISQQAKHIYANSSDSMKKRSVLFQMFNTILLDGQNLSYELKPAFVLLKKAVKVTNSSNVSVEGDMPENIFEPSPNTDARPEDTNKTTSISTSRLVWLPRLGSNQRHPR